MRTTRWRRPASPPLANACTKATPNVGYLPIAQAPPASDAAAPKRFPREHPPGYASPGHVDDARKGGPVGYARPAALGLGKLRRQ